MREFERDQRLLVRRVGTVKETGPAEVGLGNCSRATSVPPAAAEQTC